MYGTVYGSDTDCAVGRRELVRHQWVNLAEEAEPLACARAQVRQTLDGRASASVVDDAVLVASELVGNALRHTTAGPDCMNVEVYRDAAVLWVHDSGTDTERVKPRADTSNDELLECGRGLQLIDELTARWFVQPTAIGKMVVAVVELDNPGTI
ncbi:ATP-binding protein [Streptomyces sp. ISL-100]|uniref:ATP-binding protein n=1 Tax=Streptomyces sp. ISL-100 TaxID=2819173 RepID=UPI0027E4A4BF|nr:ATP-binding protein [Streptomyces sp. ISL-100]